jgi:crotonobetaine/carnitine-CoA ligase
MYEGERTAGALLARRAEESPDHPIVRFEESVMTWRDLDRRATRIANAIDELGIVHGEAIAVQLSNGPDYLAIWFGLGRAGILEVPLNVGLRGDLLAYTLNQARCRAIIVAAEWVERIDAIAGDLETLERVIVVGSGEATSLPTTNFEQLLGGATTPVTTAVTASDPHLVLFTAGTTGPSKGAMVTHGTAFECAENAVRVNEYGPGECLFTSFPLFHINARYASILPAMLLEDSAAVVHSRFSVSGFWETCRREGVTAFNFMGAVLLMLLKQPAREDDADNSVRKAWGAPAPAEIRPEFERRFGVLLSEGYGLTETGIVTSESPSARRLGSCGRTVESYAVQIQDELGDEVAPGEVGEICVRPLKPNTLFQEYFGMPEQTLEAFRGLWFHTGDRGRLDEEGWLFYVDRTKDVIRRRGEVISSWDLEQVLNAHPAIAETAVVGVPSELSEEEVLAYVQLLEGEGLGPEAILDYARERVPHFVVPRYIEFVDELPRNPQQRLQKFILRERGLPETAWDREAVGYEVKR